MKKLSVNMLIMVIVSVMLLGCSGEQPQKETTEPEATVSENTAITFEAVDLEGNPVTSEIFAESKLTAVNVWGTFCGPCIEEMPDLQLLYEELKTQDMNLIGIMVDVTEEENKEVAKDILESSNAQFTNIIPDENIGNQLLSKVSGVPTTFLIDQEGKIVGTPLVGARSKEDYMDAIHNVVKNLE